MKFYKTKSKKLAGSNYSEIFKSTFSLYKTIKAKTKRKTYIRSMYFDKQKIFLDLFWQHLHQKNLKDRTRRLKYFSCGLELIQKSKLRPITKINPNKQSELLHRFLGITENNEVFYVQIKEYLKSGQKWLISIFPEEH